MQKFDSYHQAYMRLRQITKMLCVLLFLLKEKKKRDMKRTWCWLSIDGWHVYFPRCLDHVLVSREGLAGDIHECFEAVRFVHRYLREDFPVELNVLFHQSVDEVTIVHLFQALDVRIPTKLCHFHLLHQKQGTDPHTIAWIWKAYTKMKQWKED